MRLFVDRRRVTNKANIVNGERKRVNPVLPERRKKFICQAYARKKER
jgi:hypothetical protein